MRRLVLCFFPRQDRWCLQRSDFGWLFLAVLSRRMKNDLSEICLERAISSHFDRSFDQMSALTTLTD